jgi:hypothetical protein
VLNLDKKEIHPVVCHANLGARQPDWIVLGTWTTLSIELAIIQEYSLCIGGQVGHDMGGGEAVEEVWSVHRLAHG